MALIDIDQMKALNDGQGHAAGDAALRDIAVTWHARLRAGDVLARLGGDEFGVILAGCSLEHAARVVDELRALQPASGPTYSAGIACWDGRETSAASSRELTQPCTKPKHSAGTEAPGQRPMPRAQRPHQSDEARVSLNSRPISRVIAEDRPGRGQ